MPIRIINYINVKNGEYWEPIGYLCENDWEMSSQIEAFAKWLIQNRKILPKGYYAADLGFSSKKGALGGGCVITKEAMEAMLGIGLELYLTEYPPHLKAEFMPRAALGALG